MYILMKYTRKGDNMVKDNNVENLKALAIFLVAVGHSLPSEKFIHVPQIAYYLANFIYTFHMPLFFFISGYVLIKYSRKVSRKDFILNKAKRLLLPYIFYLTLIDISKSILVRYTTNPVELSVSNLLKHIIWPWTASIHSYWFILVLFIMFLVYSFFMNLLPPRKNNFNKNILYLNIAVSSFFSLYVYENYNYVTILSIQYFFRDFIYFWFGILSGIYSEKLNLKKILDKKNYIFIFCIIFNLFFVVHNEFISSLIRVMLAFSGIVASIIFCVWYKKANLKFLDGMKEKSYSIYLLHPLSIMFFGTILKKFQVDFWIYFIVILLTNIFVPLMICKFLKSINFDRFKLIRLIIGL